MPTNCCGKENLYVTSLQIVVKVWHWDNTMHALKSNYFENKLCVYIVGLTSTTEKVIKINLPILEKINSSNH